MLSIGEFSNICKVSTKTLRYYAEIGLLLPNQINLENGYRYYSINQLETMLFINRLKSYHFSLEEIKVIIHSNEVQEELLYQGLTQKKEAMSKQVDALESSLEQIHKDILSLKQGKSIMSYLEEIDVQLVEVRTMNLLYIRKRVHRCDFSKEYGDCFGTLMKRIKDDRLTIVAPPMVLFHEAKFSEMGLDTEFAIPIQECVTGTRDFQPGLCLKTVLQGAYSNLPSIYTKQLEWAKKEGYTSSDALYEVYVTDPSTVSSTKELITEVYYPVKKK